MEESAFRPVKAVDEPEESLRLLVDAVKDYAIFTLSPDGRVMTWNSGATRIKGYEASEIIGRHFSLFYTAEDVARQKPADMLALALTRGRLEDEGLRVRKDGSTFHADVILTPIFDSRGEHRGFAKVTRDVSERVMAEQNLIQAKQAAERANRAKSNFLAIMSHELRTPLNAIVGFSDFLLSMPDEDIDTGKWRTYMGHILSGGQQLLGLVNDTLDLAGMETGRLELSYGHFDLRDAVEAVLGLVSGLAAAKNIDVVNDVKTSIPMYADASRLKQIVLNLVANAVKFTPGGGRIELKAWTQEERVLLSVTDNGIGISTLDQERIFKHFEQVKPGSGPEGGAGLGLAIARSLMEAHGGTIEVRSTPEQGSEFICCFARGSADVAP